MTEDIHLRTCASTPGVIMKRIILFVLILTNIITAVLLVRQWWDHRMMEQEVFVMATAAASLQAHADFERGILRFYELADQGVTEFTGRSDGPFEIWRWPHFPTLGKGHVYAAELFVQAYNRKMRYMEAHPDDFRFKVGASQPVQDAEDR